MIKMEKRIQILQLEDDTSDAELIQAALDSANIPCQITRVQTSTDFSKALSKGGYDLILADYRLPSYDGLSALNLVRDQYPNIPFIFVSGTLGEDAAINALTEGAIDYVTKQKLSRLAPAVGRALREAENRTKRSQAEEALRKNNALLERIFSSTEFLIAYLDADFNFIRVNRAYAEADDRTPEFFVGKNHFALYPDPENEALFRRVVETGEPYVVYAKPFVYPEHPERGTTYWNWTLQPIREADQHVSGLVFSLVNVTEREKALIAQHESDALYHNLVEQASDGIFVSDPQGNYIDVNPSGCAMLGYTREEILKLNMIDLTNTETQARKPLQFTVLRSEKSLTSERTLVTKSGALLPVEISGKVLDNGNLLGIVRDITERKLAEEALRRSEQKFRALAENIPNVVFQCKNDSRYSFLYLNNAIENLTGYPKEEFLEKGLSFFDLYHPDDLKTMPTPGENFITDINRNPFHITYRIHHRSGEWRWVDEWGTGVENADGKVEFLEGIMIDITERKQAEEALRESEERYRQLVNLSPDSITVSSQGRVVFVNPATVSIMGAKSEEELVGRGVLDFVHPDLRESIRERVESMLAAGTSTPFVEGKILRLDGSIVDVELAIVSYQQQGMGYMQIVTRDITERKRHEIEREAIIKVSQVLRKATTRTEILTMILDQLVELFDADGSMIALPNPADKETIVEMGRGIVGDRFTGLAIPQELGVSGWVIENKKPYLNNHADVDSLFYRPELLGDSHCVASVPLIAQEQSIGALWVVRHTDIMEQELRLLMAIADIAANAIHRVMLHEQTEQQLHHLIALHQIDLAISANFDVNVTLNVILKNVKDELEVDAASILLMDPVTHTLDYAAGIGFRTRGIENSHVRLGHGYAGRAAQEYRTVSGPDLNRSPEIFSRFSLLANEGFASHYATPLMVKGQVKGVLEIFHRKVLESEREWINYFETLATQAAIAIENASLFENLQRSNMELMLAYDATIEGWSRALDLRDRETEGHTQRVTEMVLELAEKMGMNDAEKMDVKRGALLHDIGKMGVPDSILNKPGPLSESEWEVMRQHPFYAFQMLSPIPYLKHALDIPYCHHEKWDGSGYPRGLKGEEIPLSARIFSLVDVFDALTSDRPYRTAWSYERVFDHIREQSGKYFDPNVVKIFLEGR